ncbi:uncharacterized protein LOC133742898 [Rosa rugosa]|uniref:uncharacterized protein LOC133742898 n=1 Tax=Rosa rugosa TaxID=74645 RepID=UPI002B417AD1|nr:uncharacterized protein LOC133742898 [Rosa rugosa]
MVSVEDKASDGFNGAGELGEDDKCPLRRWCPACGQIRRVVRGPKAEECPDMGGEKPTKSIPDESPRCPLCEGNTTMMHDWVHEILSERPYWRCCRGNGFPYCMGYIWVDEMAGEGSECDEEDGRTTKLQEYPKPTMFGPNCQVCGRIMSSFISQSATNPGRPYWFCYGYPAPTIHKPSFIWVDECKIHFAGFDGYSDFEEPEHIPSAGGLSDSDPSSFELYSS